MGSGKEWGFFFTSIARDVARRKSKNRGSLLPSTRGEKVVDVTTKNPEIMIARKRTKEGMPDYWII